MNRLSLTAIFVRIVGIALLIWAIYDAFHLATYPSNGSQFDFDFFWNGISRGIFSTNGSFVGPIEGVKVCVYFWSKLILGVLCIIFSTSLAKLLWRGIPIAEKSDSDIR